MSKPAVIAVANNKGGTGKTSTACNLAYGLSRRLRDKSGNPTGGGLVVDLDPQGNVADFFGLRDWVYDPDLDPEEGAPRNRCISFVLMEEQKWQSQVVPVTRPNQKKANLFVLPASRELEYVTSILDRDEHNRRMDMERSGRSRIEPLDTLLARVLDGARKAFRYIILDCPPKLDVLKRPVYHFADHVIVPTKAEYLSVAGTVEHTQDLFRLVDEDPSFFGARLLYILPTMVNAREVADRNMREDLAAAYGHEVIAEPIPDAVVVKESPGAGGLSVFEYDATSKPALAYAKLVNGVYARV